MENAGLISCIFFIYGRYCYEKDEKTFCTYFMFCVCSKPVYHAIECAGKKQKYFEIKSYGNLYNIQMICKTQAR